MPRPSAWFNMLLRAKGVVVSFARALKLYFVGGFFNFFCYRNFFVDFFFLVSHMTLLVSVLSLYPEVSDGLNII